jgi:DNA-binding Lrp family transcriptional regulator
MRFNAVKAEVSANMSKFLQRPFLDGIDHKILRLLRADGRMSNADLAAAIGLSASACLRRLRLLEASGVIRGYTAIIEDPAPQARTVVIVQIALERQTEDAFNRFEAAVRQCPEVCECYLMTGASDYQLRVEARDPADYERNHKEQLSRMPGVSRIQSAFAIRTVVRGAAPAWVEE